MKAMILLSFLLLFGCATPRPDIDSVSDAIVVASADVESIATTVQRLCRNEVPGGDCASGALITTAAKERMRNQLQTAQDSIVAANRLLAAGETVEAGDKLSLAEALVIALQAELARRGQ